MACGALDRTRPRSVLCAHGLDPSPRIFVNDRLVPTGEGLLPAGHQPAVQRVLEHVVDRELGELPAPLGPAPRGDIGLGSEPKLVELAGRAQRGAGLQVGLERQPDDGGFLLVDHEDARVVGIGVVAERDDAPVPESSLRPGGHAATRAVRRALALELGENQGDLQHGPARRGGGVEGLVYGDEVHTVAVEGGVELVEVQQAAGQAVELDHDDRVDLAAAHVGEKTLDLGAVGVLAGASLLPVDIGDQPPLSWRAGGDVGVQALLLLFQGALLLGGLPVRGHPQVEATAMPRWLFRGGGLLPSRHEGDPSSGARGAPVLSG